MGGVLVGFVVFIYAAATVGLLVYGLNAYVMIGLFLRRRHRAGSAATRMREAFGDPMQRDDLPIVTTQIAIYNELNVAERIMRAVAQMRYPAGRHEIQVLDDSTDETQTVVDRVACELRAAGHDVKVVRRERRVGFKGGALAEGLREARGELLAVFDADFVPPEDYLLHKVPFFVEDPRLGFAQARWGHLNRLGSILTRAQAIGIDGHFIVEQTARNWNGLYMNFNGTAGLWRKTAIEDAGGWQWDTLTEDLDLSYRVQFAGWHTLYLPGIVVPAELPATVNAFRGQQFRWAKGSFQTILKLAPRLMRQPVSVFKKLQACLHMSGYFVHPLMLTLACLALPILGITAHLSPSRWVFGLLAFPLAFSVVAPSTMYLIGQCVAHPDWKRRVIHLPLLVVVGVGFAVSNTRAILEALVGHESDFIRTPKLGDRKLKSYRIRLPWIAFVELGLGVYCAVSLGFYLAAGKCLVSPFMAIYAAGFLLIGLLTLVDSLPRADPT